MKNFFWITLLSINIGFGQVSGTIITQKFSGQDLSYHRGCVQINENEIVADRFITDMDGNVTGAIPSYLIYPGFAFSRNGVYSIIPFAYSFVDYANLNSAKNLKEGKKSEIDMTAKSKYVINQECFGTLSSEGFLPDKNAKSEYGVLANDHIISIVDNEKSLHTVEIKASGKILAQLHTENGYYYALCGGEGNLTLVKIELSTGKDEYVELDKKQNYYYGGKIDIIEDKLIVAVFSGECKNTVTMNGTYARTKMEGLLSIIVDHSAMTVLDNDYVEIPSHYADLVKMGKEENSYLEVIDILATGNDIYILSYTRQGPYALWKYSEGKTRFLHSIEPKDEDHYIRSARLFYYNGVKYLLYYEEKASMVAQKSLLLTPKLASFNDNGLSPMSVDIPGLGKLRGDLDLRYSYLTSTGVILIPASYSEIYTGYLMTIKL